MFLLGYMHACKLFSLQNNISDTMGVLTFSNWNYVLGLARTGLIFTGLQEGAQPGVGG